MQGIKTGMMLCQIREQKRIPRKNLCVGLCSSAALSKYESGERTPDGLLFHYFIQRLGMPPEDFSVMLSLNEYQYFTWKENVFQAIQEEKWERLEKLSHNEWAKDRNCNAKIQNQFYLYLSSVLAEKVEKDSGKALLLLQDAIKETVPDFLENNLDTYCLSIMEIGLMVLYFYKGGVLGYFSSNEVYFRLKDLMKYVKRVITDKRECARLIPEIVCVFLHISIDQMDIRERLSLEEEAIRLLKESYKLYHLPEILKFYVRDLEQKDKRKARIYKKQYEAFLEVFEDNGYDTAFQEELLFDSHKQIYLLDEYMRSNRDISGMTQEQASDGICAPETYSRLETGKRAPHPKEREALLERLEIGWGYFRGDIETTDYKVLELLNFFRGAAARNEWQKAEEYAQELKSRMDMESINNRQYIGMIENRIAYFTRRITAEEIYYKDKKLLELSVTEERLEKTEIYYFSHVEILLHTHIANVLCEMGKRQEGIKLLERVLKKTEKSAVGIEYWWNGMNVTIFNLANMLSDEGEYMEALRYMEGFIKTCMRMSDGKYVAYGIGEKAFDLEHLEKANKAVCKRLLKQAFYLTDFYEIQGNHKQVKMYLEEHYDVKKQWYVN